MLTEAKASFETFTSIRWFAAIFIAILAVGCHYFLGTELFQAPLFMVLSILVLSNLFLGLDQGFRGSYLAGIRLGIAIDMIFLGGFLYFYGGYQNPFSMFYLVLIVEAAFFLTPKDTWVVFVLTVVSLLALFNFYIPIPMLAMDGVHGGHHAGHGFSVHLHGMFVAFLVIGFLISFFLVSLQQRLVREREKVLSLNEFASKQYQRAAMHSMTAQLAHELATPLTTATMIADDLCEAAEHQTQEVQEQFCALQKALNRAGSVIQQMREHYSRFDMVERNEDSQILLVDIIQSAAERFSAQASMQVVIDEALASYTPLLPSAGLMLCFSSLIENAVRYGAAHRSVRVHATPSPSDTSVIVMIENDGNGFSDELLREVGQPMPVSSDRGGLGLGLFLVKDFIEQAGGSLHVKNIMSSLGEVIGAAVIVEIPSHPVPC
jgi:two-component system sensor histidine kinase RegB